MLHCFGSSDLLLLAILSVRLRRNDVPVEYNSEEQAICAVGLVRPLAGVFAEAIQYLLVLCTTTEVCPKCVLTVVQIASCNFIQDLCVTLTCFWNQFKPI